MRVGLEGTQLLDAVIELAAIAGVVANVCDHAEHNEPYKQNDLVQAGHRLRLTGVDLAHSYQRSPLDLYRNRLKAIERRNVLHHDEAFDGAARVDDHATWRDLQLLQAAHDRYYHPDVMGLSKSAQLRHYALHLAKLAGAAADATNGRVSVDDFITRRVADAILFGIKLATVVGDRLPEEPVSTPCVLATQLSR